MDITSLLSSLLSGSNVDEISDQTGVSAGEVRSVLSALSETGGQADEDTARAVAKKSGVDLSSVIKIISAAAPFLQNLLGLTSTDTSSDSSASSGGLGGLLGGLLGFGFAQLISVHVFGNSITLQPMLLPAAILLSMAIAALSCLLPIRRAVAIDPALVLKGE